jgi:type IV secretory pathway TraG/TraD family ATPase VirD4
MGLFSAWAKATGASIWWANRAGTNLGQSLALGRERAKANPGSRARKMGILAPGDAPGVAGGYLDYRGIGLPNEYPQITDAVMRLGEVIHPHGRSSWPAWVGWKTINEHVAIVGPPGSGKTVLLATSIVGALSAGMSVVAVDTKGDLLAEIKRVRGDVKLGVPVRRWDIAETRDRVMSWNPLDEIEDDSTLQAVVTGLLGEVNINSKDLHFQKRDHRWLKGLLRLTRISISKASLATSYALLLDQNQLAAYVAAHPNHSKEIIDLVSLSPQDFSLATAGLANALSWADQITPARMTATSDFSAKDCMDYGGLTIIGSRMSAGEPAYAAAAAFLGVLRTRIFSRFGSSEWPTILVLDEVPKYADRIELSSLLDLSRGADVGILLGLQNVDQLGDAGNISTQLGNCGTVIILSGSTEKTARFMASRCGEHTVKTVSMSVDAHGRSVPTTSNVTIPILGTREIMQPPLGEYVGIIHSRGLCAKPFLVDFTNISLV